MLRVRVEFTVADAQQRVPTILIFHSFRGAFRGVGEGETNPPRRFTTAKKKKVFFAHSSDGGDSGETITPRAAGSREWLDLSPRPILLPIHLFGKNAAPLASRPLCVRFLWPMHE